MNVCFVLFPLFDLCFVDFPSVLWYCWLGLLTCKNRLPYNLYCVGGDVKHCTIQSIMISLALLVSIDWMQPKTSFSTLLFMYYYAKSSKCLQTCLLHVTVTLVYSRLTRRVTDAFYVVRWISTSFVGVFYATVSKCFWRLLGSSFGLWMSRSSGQYNYSYTPALNGLCHF